MYKRRFFGLLLTALMILTVGPSASAQYLPTVSADDQEIVDGVVVIENATINGPGWVVIHADADGAPGPVLGYAQLAPGANTSVSVELDMDGVTPTLHAMLHVDAGEEGTYEFPGPDGPVKALGSVIMAPFAVTMMEAEADAAAEAQEEAMEEMDAMDIVDTAVAAGTFNTLVAAVQAADLVDTLKSAGPFTVFAPTDDAFAALPEGTVDALLADPAALAEILLYHVVPDSLMADDVVKMGSSITALGPSVSFSTDGDKVMVDDAQIVATDIEATNGVIHVIDSVILPPAEEAMAEGEEEAMEEMDAMDIVDTAVAAGAFNTLVAAVQAADLVDTLKSAGPFTVFAPTDDAFAALPEGTVDALLADPEALAEILLYHVVPGKVMSGDLSDGLMAATAQGSDISFTLGDAGAMVNDANITDVDIETANGVIHVIDSVLLPPEEEPMAEESMAEETMEAPETLPETGGDFGSTIPVVTMVLLALAAVAFASRRREAR